MQTKEGFIPELTEACAKSIMAEYFAFVNVKPKFGTLFESFKTISILSDKQLGQTKYMSSISDLVNVLLQKGHSVPIIFIIFPQFGHTYVGINSIKEYEYTV